MFARTQHGVEEDAAESDLGATFVTEGVIDDQPDGRTGNEIAEQLDEHEAGEIIPVPDGLIEEAIGFGVVGVGSLPGGLPDAGDGASSQANNPGSNHDAEGGMNRFVETPGKRGEQDEQRRGKLEHERTS